MKKKMRRRLLLVIIFLILAFIIFAVGSYLIRMGNNKQTEVKVISEIQQYGYKLEDNKTRLYNNLFDELDEELNKKDINEQKYAELVAKLFVVDFYNLENKLNKNDIGGIQFVYTSIRDNFILNAKNTLYKYIESNTNGGRNQELPVVSNVEVVNSKNDSYDYGKKTDTNAYKLTLHWSYKKNLGYQTEADLILIHEGKKLSIVELDSI